MAKASNRKITLPQICWKTIKDLMNAPGWATTPKLIITAGGLVVDEGKLGENVFSPEPVAVPGGSITRQQWEAWNKKTVTVELLSREIEAIEKCLRHFVAQGNIGVNKWSMMLMKEFLGDE